MYFAHQEHRKSLKLATRWPPRQGSNSYVLWNITIRNQISETYRFDCSAMIPENAQAPPGSKSKFGIQLGMFRLDVWDRN
jgi:hypothetical protein